MQGLQNHMFAAYKMTHRTLFGRHRRLAPAAREHNVWTHTAFKYSSFFKSRGTGSCTAAPIVSAMSRIVPGGVQLAHSALPIASRPNGAAFVGQEEQQSRECTAQVGDVADAGGRALHTTRVTTVI